MSDKVKTVIFACNNESTPSIKITVETDGLDSKTYNEVISRLIKGDMTNYYDEVKLIKT